MMYSKTCLKQPLIEKTKNWFLRPIIAECRPNVLQNALLEHSAILSIFIKLPFVFNIFLSIFEWPLKTGFTVLLSLKVVLFLANSADLDEMQHYAAFHLGLHCLPKYLFDLILYVPSTIFQLCQDGSSWVEPVLSKDKCVLLKDTTVTPVRIEPVTPRSRVKHSTTQPLCSPKVPV